MAITKRYDHANEERYSVAVEALDMASKTGKAEGLAAARWKQILKLLRGSELAILDDDKSRRLLRLFP